MDPVAFEAIKSCLKEMDSTQLHDLFRAVADANGIIVACAAYREDYNETLKEYGKPPLSDDEWKLFHEKLFKDVYVDEVRSRWCDARDGVIEEHVRKIWEDDDSEQNDESEELTPQPTIEYTPKHQSHE
jgi:hypothetical protein